MWSASKERKGRVRLQDPVDRRDYLDGPAHQSVASLRAFLVTAFRKPPNPGSARRLRFPRAGPRRTARNKKALESCSAQLRSVTPPSASPPSGPSPLLRTRLRWRASSASAPASPVARAAPPRKIACTAPLARGNILRPALGHDPATAQPANGRSSKIFASLAASAMSPRRRARRTRYPERSSATRGHRRRRSRPAPGLHISPHG